MCFGLYSCKYWKQKKVCLVICIITKSVRILWATPTVWAKSNTHKMKQFTAEIKQTELVDIYVFKTIKAIDSAHAVAKAVQIAKELTDLKDTEYKLTNLTEDK